MANALMMLALFNLDDATILRDEAAYGDRSYSSTAVTTSSVLRKANHRKESVSGLAGVYAHFI